MKISHVDQSAFPRTRSASLGHFLAWLVCDAHTHPQEAPPPELLALFPYDGVPSTGDDD